MKKNQDIKGIESSPTPGTKIAQALFGNLSQRNVILGEFEKIEGIRNSIDRSGDTPGDRVRAMLENSSDIEAAMDAYQTIGMVIHDAIKAGNCDLFKKLAEYVEFPAINDPKCGDATSPIDFAVLELQFNYGDTWPTIPMTRDEIGLYLARNGIAPPDPKTLSAVLKRCGVSLKKTKPGPKAERRRAQ